MTSGSVHMFRRKNIDFTQLKYSVKVTVVMDRACRDEDVGRAVERMWQRRFAAHGPHPSRHDDPDTMY